MFKLTGLLIKSVNLTYSPLIKCINGSGSFLKQSEKLVSTTFQLSSPQISFFFPTTIIQNRNFHLTAPKHQIKKRSTRIKLNEEGGTTGRHVSNVLAFSTAEEYNLEGLVAGLMKQNLYEPKRFYSTDDLDVEPDVLYVKAKYEVDEEPRDIFFFREGTVVLWNVSEIESGNVLSFLRQYEAVRV